MFKRIRVLKSKVAGQHPEAFAAVTAAKDATDDGKEEDDEYDVAIRKQRQQRLQEKEAGGAGRISPIPETS